MGSAVLLARGLGDLLVAGAGARRVHVLLLPAHRRQPLGLARPLASLLLVALPLPLGQPAFRVALVVLGRLLHVLGQSHLLLLPDALALRLVPPRLLGSTGLLLLHRQVDVLLDELQVPRVGQLFGRLDAPQHLLRLAQLSLLQQSLGQLGPHPRVLGVEAVTLLQQLPLARGVPLGLVDAEEHLEHAQVVAGLAQLSQVVAVLLQQPLVAHQQSEDEVPGRRLGPLPSSPQLGDQGLLAAGPAEGVGAQAEAEVGVQRAHPLRVLQLQFVLVGPPQQVVLVLDELWQLAGCCRPLQLPHQLARLLAATLPEQQRQLVQQDAGALGGCHAVLAGEGLLHHPQVLLRPLPSQRPPHEQQVVLHHPPQVATAHPLQQRLIGSEGAAVGQGPSLPLGVVAEEADGGDVLVVGARSESPLELPQPVLAGCPVAGRPQHEGVVVEQLLALGSEGLLPEQLQLRGGEVGVEPAGEQVDAVLLPVLGREGRVPQQSLHDEGGLGVLPVAEVGLRLQQAEGGRGGQRLHVLDHLLEAAPVVEVVGVQLLQGRVGGRVPELLLAQLLPHPHPQRRQDEAVGVGQVLGVVPQKLLAELVDLVVVLAGHGFHQPADSLLAARAHQQQCDPRATPQLHSSLVQSKRHIGGDRQKQTLELSSEGWLAAARMARLGAEAVSLKGYWTQERDNKLIELINKYRGRLNWNQLSEVFPGVSGRLVRDRWRNHLDPRINKKPWTPHEDQILKKCYLKFRNNWAVIAGYLEGRTPNQLRSRIRSQSFKDLFPTCMARKDPPRNRKKARAEPTIGQDIDHHHQEQHLRHRTIKDELAADESKSLVEEEQPSADFMANHERRRRHPSKRRCQQLTTLYLLKTCRLVQSRVERGHLAWQGRSRKEVLVGLRDLQWVVGQLWPMVNPRPNQTTFDQDVAFLLYSIFRAESPLAQQILNRLVRCCSSEDYMLRKVEAIIHELDSFITQQLSIIRDRRLLEKHNTEQLSKVNLEEEATQTGTSCSSKFEPSSVAPKHDAPESHSSPLPQPVLRSNVKLIAQNTQASMQGTNLPQDIFDESDEEQSAEFKPTPFNQPLTQAPGEQGFEEEKGGYEQEWQYLGENEGQGIEERQAAGNYQQWQRTGHEKGSLHSSCYMEQANGGEESRGAVKREEE